MLLTSVDTNTSSVAWPIEDDGAKEFGATQSSGFPSCHLGRWWGAQVKVIEGLGTTMDVVLVNGTMREGAQIVVCGLGAPIVTNIRSLLTPHPMKVRV